MSTQFQPPFASLRSRLPVKTGFFVFISLVLLMCGNSPGSPPSAVGQRVVTNGTVNVRSTAAGSVAGTQSTGRKGTTTGGPTTATLSGTSYTWWNVNFDSGTDGWVASIGIDLAPPDVLPQSLSVSPTSGAPGSSATVSFSIKNQGGTTASSFITRIRLSTSSSAPSTSDPLLDEFTTSSLSAGSTTSKSRPVTIPNGTSSGTRYVWVVVDATSTAGQDAADEDNDLASKSFSVTGAPAPSISSVSPTSMPASSSNQTFTINGSNFVSGATLTFTAPSGTYASTASKLTFVSSSRIDYLLNNGNESGAWTVRVNNPDVQSSGTRSFTVTATPNAPTVSSITPNPVTGSASAQTFVVMGSNFVSGAKVQVAYSPGYTFVNTNINATFNSPTRLTVPIITTTTADTWKVRVVNPDTQTSNQIDLTVNAPITSGFGDSLGSFNGITAYSNGSASYVSNIYNSVSGYNTGLKWQCVEYVNRYYYSVYGMSIRIAGQDAFQYYGNATARGLSAYSNAGNTAPQAGDILCFSGGSGGLGHVSLVREVGSNYVKVIQQNATQDSRDAEFMHSMVVNGNTYTVSGSSLGASYVCQGWLRKPGLGIPDYEGATWAAAATGNYEAGNRSSSAVRWIIIHTTDGSAADTIAWFQNSASQASAHYMVARTGAVTQFVIERDVAYTAGNYAYNLAAINIEIEQSGTETPTTAQYSATADLVRAIQQRFSVPTSFPTGITPASPTSGAGIIGHNQVPDPYNPALGGGASHHYDPVNWDWAVFQSYFGVLPTVLTPTISPNGGNHTGSVMVTLACATSGATIRYTTNGSDPTTSSAVYSGPFTLTSSAMVKATAFKSGSTDSLVAQASFTVNPANYTISVSASPGAGGSASGSGTFPSGSSRTVTATANSGYTFTNWTEGGTILTTSATYAFTLNGNRTLAANFTAINYTITLSASPSAGGTTSGAGSHAYGSSRTVTATPNSGYTFTNWTQSGLVVSTSASHTFTLTASRALVANFTSVNHTISLSAEPSTAGVISGTGSYATGTSRTVTATANSGYTFSNWTEGGSIVSTSAIYAFTLSTNRTLVANFAAQSGSLMVTIYPAEAASAGARWQVDGGALQNGGTTLAALPTGTHTVAFKEVAGWRAPASQMVTVSSNQTTNTAGTYISLEGTVAQMLWTDTSGTAQLWSLDANEDYIAAKSYGPYPGWKATSYRQNADGTGNLLWSNRSTGQAMLWKTDANGDLASQRIYGPHPGARATSYHQNADGTGKLLWTYSRSGDTVLWTTDANGDFVGSKAYGRHPRYQAASYQRHSESAGTLLWSHTSGAVQLWLLDTNDDPSAAISYGPYAGWTATSHFQNVDGTGKLLWTDKTGRAMLWTLDVNGSYVTQKDYGPFTGWIATDYGR